MKRTCLAILVASTALVPAAVLAQTSNEAAPAQQTTQQTAQQSESRPITAASLSNQVIYDQSGREFGRVGNIVRSQGDQMFAVVTTADNQQYLVPVKLVSYQNNRLTFQGTDKQLTAYKEGAGNYQAVGQEQQIDIAGAQSEQAGQAEGSKIVVQQPAPSIQVQQAAPRVSVQQPEAQVTVRQPTPQILVRQPAPTVTVDIPTPEIIVRMPRPDVNVAMAQPQVEVQQPEPQVQILQPESQSAVQVERAQPQVSVQEGQAQVSLQEQGQPQVTYERAEPRLVVNQAQGQPKVRYEQIEPGQAPQEQALATGEQQTATQQSATQQEPAQPQRAQRTAEQRQAYFKRFGGDINAQLAGAQSAVSVSDVKNMDVWNGQGERLGEVDEVIAINNKPHLVIAHGGFLGIGEDKVAFPLDRFVLSGENHLVIRGVTEQDIEAMDEWQSKVDIEDNKIAENTQVKLPQLQSQ